MQTILRYQLLLFSLLVFISGHAQKGDSSLTKKKFDALEERSKVTYKFIPLPSFEPSTKWGISAIGMANYYPNKKDTISPPSVTGLGGNITTNGSWGLGAFQKLNLKEDAWRFSGNLFHFQINQVLELGPLGAADAKRIMNIANLSAKKKIFKRLFVGLGYSFKRINYEGKEEESQGKLDLAGFSDKNINHGIKYILSYDTRDNISYPYQGILVDYTLGQYLKSKSSESANDFLEHNIDIRQYITLFSNNDHVLSWHLFGRFLTGNPANENFSFYGRSSALVQRGYEVGNFIDKNLVTAEVEYRLETPLLKRKLGFIGFGSIGKVYGEFSNFQDADWLPAIGIGGRYRILDYERVNIRCDIAYGKEGWTIYFGIREAF